MVRNRVEELRANAVGQTLLELLDVESVLVHGNREHLGLETAKSHDRAKVRRSRDDEEVVTIEERLADELERLDRAARDQQLVAAGATALSRLESRRERVERSGEAARGRVLEGGRLARGGKLREQLGGAATRKR